MAQNTFLSDDYLKALGAVTVHWATLESALDFLAIITFAEYGKHPRHRELPRSTKRKIEYLRDYAKQPLMNEWKDELLELASSVANLKEERHDAVHGCVVESEEGSAKVLRLLHRAAKHEYTDRHFTVEELWELAACLAIDASAALDLTTRLIDAVEERGDQTLGE